MLTIYFKAATCLVLASNTTPTPPQAGGRQVLSTGEGFFLRENGSFYGKWGFLLREMEVHWCVLIVFGQFCGCSVVGCWLVGPLGGGLRFSVERTLLSQTGQERDGLEHLDPGRQDSGYRILLCSSLICTPAHTPHLAVFSPIGRIIPLAVLCHWPFYNHSVLTVV